MDDLSAQRQHPHPLAAHYQRFRVADRLLLTGHSHQAWPDVGLAAQRRAWLDAADLVDDKWERARAQADAVRAGFARLLGDAPERIALGPSTHDLLVKLLSALPLAQRPRVVTTDGEFHTARRQLDRLSEEGLEVHRVAAAPVSTLAERLAAAVDDRTALVLVSAVLYQTAQIVPHLEALPPACARVGAALLVDAYHALNVVPFELGDHGLETAWVTGGGYKYCQLGEGNAFLRLPPGARPRPVVTGWFAEFGALEQDAADGAVVYADGPDRFAGATYDPTSHYRGAAVFDFFRDQGLTPTRLRAISQHQVGRLVERFDALDADPALVSRDRDTPLTGRAGFLVLRSPRAAAICSALRDRGVATDVRGQALRLGPAPYLSDAQLDRALDALADVLAARP